jgi:gluconokinase
VQIAVMGVSGSGKSTVAALLAARLGCELAEADDFHPASNVAKMSAGLPLDDADRLPWLRDIAAWLGERARANRPAVVACSALRRRYRDVLRGASPRLLFVHLTGTGAVIASRMRARPGHFMPPSLLESQLATLEPLEADEQGLILDVGRSPEELVAAVLAAISAAPPA